MRAFLFIGGLAAGLAFNCLPAMGAQNGVPQVRASISLKQEAWVGQKVVLLIELLAPGYFSGTPQFDFPQIPGVLLIQPEGSPVSGTEDVKGQGYIVQRYEVALFARRPGTYEIPSFKVRFGFKYSPLDQDATFQEAFTPNLRFTAKLPPGAENLTALISARDLEIREEWKPASRMGKVGNAFTRTITFTATDVPGMAFPHFPVSPIEGLGVYSREPVISDQGERGELRGNRRDVVTYVCQRPGRFVVPAVKLTWWNMDDQSLHVISLPEHVFEVAADPAWAGQAKPEGGLIVLGLEWGGMILGMALVLAGTLFWTPWSVFKKAFGFLYPTHLQPLNPLDVRK